MTSQKEEKRKKKDPLGERMKEYEGQTAMFLEKEQPWIVRLDGHHFSKFTRGFRKPFDERLGRAMVSTASDLLSEFTPTLVFTQSDEITMVFPALLAPAKRTEEQQQQQQQQQQQAKEQQQQRQQTKEQQQLFGGKVSKITTLMASFCAVRFNFHLRQEDFGGAEEVRLREKVERCVAYFDARAFNVPTEVEAVNNVLWRSHVDCRRNSINNLGSVHFSHREMQGMTSQEVYQRLRTEKGVEWDAYPGGFKFGTFVKKEQFSKEAVDVKTDSVVTVMRTKVEARSFALAGFQGSHVPLLFAKYWRDYDALVTRQEEQGQGDKQEQQEQKQQEQKQQEQEQEQEEQEQ